jgi:hypothetical protein
MKLVQKQETFKHNGQQALLSLELQCSLLVYRQELFKTSNK